MGRSATKKREGRGRVEVKLVHHRGGRKWMLGAILAIGIAAGVAAWEWKDTLWLYKMAPSFSLSASNGRLISLSDYRGKQEVVVIFYMGAG